MDFPFLTHGQDVYARIWEDPPRLRFGPRSPSPYPAGHHLYPPALRWYPCSETLRATGHFSDVTVRLTPPRDSPIPGLTRSLQDPSRLVPVPSLGVVTFTLTPKTSTSTSTSTFSAASLAGPRARATAQTYRASHPWTTTVAVVVDGGHDEQNNSDPLLPFAAMRSPPPPPPSVGVNPVGDALAFYLTSTYGQYQSAAGTTAGVGPGLAWKTAVVAALDVHVPLVVMGDRPTDVTRARLGNGLLAGFVPRLIASLLGLSLGLGTLPEAMPDLDLGVVAGYLGATTVLGTLGLLLGPWVGPLLEVRALSKLATAQEVEAQVAVGTPGSFTLAERGTKGYRLPGEDALLDWPGAEAAILGERDAFMAATAAALARGGTGYGPVWVGGRGGGWMRIGMPGEGLGKGLASAPVGMGEGVLEAAPVRSGEGEEGEGRRRRVVAVVGTAHVGGMVAYWEEAVGGKLDVSTLL